MQKEYLQSQYQTFQISKKLVQNYQLSIPIQIQKYKQIFSNVLRQIPLHANKRQTR